MTTLKQSKQVNGLTYVVSNISGKRYVKVMYKDKQVYNTPAPTKSSIFIKDVEGYIVTYMLTMEDAYHGNVDTNMADALHWSLKNSFEFANK